MILIQRAIIAVVSAGLAMTHATVRICPQYSFSQSPHRSMYQINRSDVISTFR